MAEVDETQVDEAQASEADADVAETVSDAADTVEEAVAEGAGAEEPAAEDTAEADEAGADEAGADEAGADEAVVATVVAEEPVAEAPKIRGTFEFQGSKRNLVVGAVMLFCGLMAFSMKMTGTFFAEATAWTFVAWGILLLFSDLLELVQSYELTDNAFIIKNPVRYWYPRKEWLWDDIYRMDVIVKRKEAAPEDTVLQVYHEVEGELTKEREDRSYDPEFAQIVIERAGLQPVEDEAPRDLGILPIGKATYHWTKSGSLA